MFLKILDIFTNYLVRWNVNDTLFTKNVNKTFNDFFPFRNILRILFNGNFLDGIFKSEKRLQQKK